MTELREAAVNDALAKASHFAGLTGVAVGQLTFIAEIGSGTPVVQNFQEDAFARVAAAPSVATLISGGELELSLKRAGGLRDPVEYGKSGFLKSVPIRNRDALWCPPHATIWPS